MKINLLERSGYDSETLFNEINIQESDVLDKIQTGLTWLQDNHVNCVLIGGTAVAHYLPTARTLTPDFDFLTPNFNQLKSLLSEQSIPAAPLASTNAEELGITVPEFNTDFLDINSGNKAINKYVIKTAITGNIGGVSLKIVSPEALVIMKFALGRDKDDNDAFALLQSGVVSKLGYLEALQDLKSNVDYLTLQGYSKLIK